jgi:UDP-N-acetylmuramate dehydrogenase
MQMRETEKFTGLRGELRPQEPMARHVSWRTGGVADRCYVPADLDDLAVFLKQLPAREPLLFVGLGSNLLVRDAGFRGTAVLMHSAAHRPALAAGLVYADAGVASPKVARFAALHDLSGAEFLAGIPGTVGGALAMNAGCYGAETWDIVEKVATIDRNGVQRVRARAEFATSYRHCASRTSGEEWFVAAWFRLAPGEGALSRARMKEFLARRVATQPLQLPNAGSVFRNPAGDYAARLIESCGLKGLTRGGAQVSEKHANFIVNPKGRGRASDIEWLIETVRATVRERTGVDLQPEVRIVGEPA